MIKNVKNACVAAAGLASGLLVTTPALAQDGAESWTGPYVGGRLGYAFQGNDNDETVLFDTDLNGTFGDTVNTAAGANAFSPGFCGGAALSALPSGGCREDRDGTDWAVHAGYDVQFGGLVVGLVGDYGRTNIRDSVSAYSTTPAFYTLTRRVRDNASARLRAGVALGDTLVYGTGGAAWAKVRNSFTTSNTANSFTNTGNDDAWGYRFGGGIEHRVSRNFSIGAQYLYTRIEDEDYRVRAAGPAPATNPFILRNSAGTDFGRTGDRFNWHSAQVTASFRF